MVRGRPYPEWFDLQSFVVEVITGIGRTEVTFEGVGNNFAGFTSIVKVIVMVRKKIVETVAIIINTIIINKD